MLVSPVLETNNHRNTHRQLQQRKFRQVRDFNEARREMRAVAAQQTKEQDLVLLDYAIQKDKAGEAEEQAKREEEKRVSEAHLLHV